MEAKDFVDELVARARKAQEEYEKFSQEQADAIVRACAKAVYDNAEYLARLAVDETRMGVYEHKIQKNKGKAKVIWNSLKGKKSVGILSRNEETGITEIARPVGVVGAVTPCTNPVVTPMCNAMFALKGLNAIIIGPHPRSKNTSYETVRLMNEAIAKLGAPKNLIQIIEEPTVELSSALMHAVDVVVATGRYADGALRIFKPESRLTVSAPETFSAFSTAASTLRRRYRWLSRAERSTTASSAPVSRRLSFRRRITTRLFRYS